MSVGGAESDSGRGTEAAACATVQKRFCEQAQHRLEHFYADLARFGEAPPAARLRLEGFLEAGLALELVARDELARWVHDSYSRHLSGEQGRSVPAVLAERDECAIALPVRWRRAPVYRS